MIRNNCPFSFSFFLFLLSALLIGHAGVSRAVAAEQYTLEIIASVGDIADGLQIIDFDTDDHPPVINNFGEIGFFAPTNAGETLFYRAESGIYQALFSARDIIQNPITGNGATFWGADEEETTLQISETGHVYYASDSDFTFVTVDDVLMHNFPDEDMDYVWQAAGLDGFAFNKATFDRFDGVYLHGYVTAGRGFDDNGKPLDITATIKDYGISNDDEKIILLGGIIDGHEVLSYGPVIVSPTGRITFNGGYGRIFFENKLRFTPDMLRSDENNIASAVVGDVNDSGDLLIVGFDVENEQRLLFVNDELRLSEDQPYRDGVLGGFGPAHLTADGSVLVKTGYCVPDCENRTGEGDGGFFLNGELAVSIKGEILRDLVPDAGIIRSFSRFSTNDRGDIVFFAGFEDGIKRLLVARRNIPERFGDVNNDNSLDLADIYNISKAIQSRGNFRPQFDLNGDKTVDVSDLAIWVHDVKGTYFGDADLNGEFNSSDLVRLFTFAEYEDNFRGNSSWMTGDFNGDGEFSSSDLVLAFQDNGYEKGPRPATRTVPEPAFGLAPLIFLALVLSRRRMKQPSSF